MMVKIELPIQDTIINTFNVYGSISSIISNNKKCFPWFYNNFIQIRYVYDWDTFFFDNHHLLLDNCPWLNHHIVPRFVIESKWDSIVDFIVDSIKLGHYVYLYVDRYFISTSKAYLKWSHVHEIFIYGFNSESKKFLIADNLSDGKYVQTECTFEEIAQGHNAIEVSNHFFLNIHLLSKKEEEEYTLNLPQIILSIENYLNSVITLDVSFKEKTLFGQNAILFSVDKMIKDENKLLDKRAFHLFLEHKKLMLSRINYLIHVNELKYEHVSESYKDILRRFEIIKNLSLRYNITKDRDVLFRIRDQILDGLYEEKLILDEMIKLISK
ncbi:hypothetical protein MKZ12_17985 [Paenibacillus sp. FSL R5-0713]|uniref:hypothetical protein n=1 Tax=Paenibacillus sp. FSL R5-0713 TaxID=2921655 RepID=UPI0030D76980